MYDPEQITFFAKTDARGQQVPFGIKAKDRTRHVYVIGKTGMGKSTLLENMAAQDLKNGNGLAFIDPHGATAETLLEYIPDERKDDVLYFAPFDTDNPISFNVMEDVGPDKRHLVVAGLMSVFKKIWVDAWSARMEYILSNTLLALLEYPDSTLLGVNRMLSDKDYRKKVIDNITDPAVKSFWVDEFLKYNERYMQEAGDAIKNKIGQFTSNPLIRNIIGQPRTSFDIRKVMDERKIMIINLSKGLVGEQNANLLGSMMTTRIYLAAMSRADLSSEQLKAMPNFYFYVDEFQSFANATFADILSEARKYKLNLTIAHQYIEQMEEEVRNAVFGNVGTIISFRVGPFDAEVLETVFTPKFLAPDIVNLGFAQIYLTLMIDGIGSPPFSATTLPPIEPPVNSSRDDVVALSRQHYSKKRDEVQTAIHAWHDQSFSDKPPYVPKHLREKADGGELPNTGENLKKYGVDGVAPKDQQNTSAESGQSRNTKTEKPRNGGDRKNHSSNSGNTGDSYGRNNSASTGNGSRDSKYGQQQRTDAHKNQRPAQNDKSLEELRSVLKEISGSDSESKELKVSPKGPNKGARDEKGNLKKDPDALKDALAAALGSTMASAVAASRNESETKTIEIDEKKTMERNESVSKVLEQVEEPESVEEEVVDAAIEEIEAAVKDPEERKQQTGVSVQQNENTSLSEDESPLKKKRRRRRRKKRDVDSDVPGSLEEASSQTVTRQHSEATSANEQKSAVRGAESKTNPLVVTTPDLVRVQKADTLDEAQEQSLIVRNSEAVLDRTQEAQTVSSKSSVAVDTQREPVLQKVHESSRGENHPESKGPETRIETSTPAVAAASQQTVSAHTQAAKKPYFDLNNEYAQAKNRKTVDPLEPKKLERMMRVTTSDKLPLK